jgi:hypothetical protein
MKSANLNFLEPSGPLQACNGTALPFTYILQPCSLSVVESTSWIILNHMTLNLEITRTYFSHNQICLSKGSALCWHQYICLPMQIKLLSSNFHQFKKSSWGFFLQLHSFYTSAEYWNYNRDLTCMYYILFMFEIYMRISLQKLFYSKISHCVSFLNICFIVTADSL